jgi:hypothetical protein
MRSIGAGFGLVAFLIAIAISLWMWSTYTAEVSKYGTKAQKEAQQFAGQDENGRLAIKSLSLTPEEQNGKVKYVLVDAIDPQGAYAKWFHLQQNDAIIAVGPMDLRDQDAEMAHALIQEAYQRQQELTIMRGGKKIVLPEGRLEDGSLLASGPTVAPTPTTQPAQSAGEQERVVPKELAPLRGIIR